MIQRKNTPEDIGCLMKRRNGARRSGLPVSSMPPTYNSWNFYAQTYAQNLYKKNFFIPFSSFREKYGVRKTGYRYALTLFLGKIRAWRAHEKMRQKQAAQKTECLLFSPQG
jgi:hypothetical protein